MSNKLRGFLMIVGWGLLGAGLYLLEGPGTAMSCCGGLLMLTAVAGR